MKDLRIFLFFVFTLIAGTAGAAHNVRPAAQWKNAATLETLAALNSNVPCPVGQTTKLLDFIPSWSYVSGFSHIGTWVYASFQLENTSDVDATDVFLLLGTGNYVAGPFTVKAGQDLFVSGMAGDGFTAPTTSADYSPMIVVPSNSAAGVTAISASNGTSIVEFTHPF